ncbi:MAG: alanine racemase [Oscillospiraceae bacterium]
MENAQKRCWAEISLAAIEHNYREMRSKLPIGCKFLAVVKANAYGHGAIAVAKMLEQKGCDYIAVACLDEAEELRKAGICAPILILGPTPTELAPRLFELKITQAVGSLEMALGLSKALEGSDARLKIHLKLETGMGRTGFDVKRGDVTELLAALKLKNLYAEGIFTHFAVSDEPSREDYTAKQFKIFCESVSKIEALTGHSFEIKHCANSGAMINYPKTYLDMVRPGLALYGLYPAAETGEISLRPALSLKARVASITEHEKGDSISYGCLFTATEKTRLAVVSIGYADGLHRILSNNMDVLIKGHRVHQLGRICMDMCMVDITPFPDISVNDVATIYGTDGKNLLPIEEQAAKAQTISYELLCAISPRVPRVYID